MNMVPARYGTIVERKKVSSLKIGFLIQDWVELQYCPRH